MAEGITQFLDNADPLILLGLFAAFVAWGVAALIEGDLTGGETYRRNSEDLDIFGDGDD